MSIPDLATAAPAQRPSAPGVLAYVDQNHYFSFEYPADWEISELKDTVGLTLRAPQVENEWRARVKINVRVCPRSQTLDRTLYLIRAEMLQLFGVRFVGQSAGQHPSGKPAGTLRWSMLQSSTKLLVEQLFIAVNPGVILQLTASAASQTYPKYQSPFAVVLTSVRSLPALMTRALLLPSAPGTTAAPAAPGAVTGRAKPETGTLRAPTAMPAPNPTAAPLSETQPIVEIEPSDPVVAAPSPAVASVEPSLRPEFPTRQPRPETLSPLPAKVESQQFAPEAAADSTIDLRDEPSEADPVPAEATELVQTQTIPTPPSPEPATIDPPATEQSMVAAPPPPPDYTQAYTRIWVYLDLTAKTFVSEMRKASKRNGIKPGQKALFEGRTYLCDALSRVIAAAPVDLAHGKDLTLFVQKKIAGRSRELRDEFVERFETYARATLPPTDCTQVSSETLKGTTVGVLAGYLMGKTGAATTPATALENSQSNPSGSDSRQEFLKALTGVDAEFGEKFRQSIALLFKRLPATWSQLDATGIEDELGHA